MRYKLFLSDFDGTLVRGDGTISKENIEAIGEYRRRGGIFAVVTGRMVRSILPRLKELGLKEGLVVAYQGGFRPNRRRRRSASSGTNISTPISTTNSLSTAATDS